MIELLPIVTTQDIKYADHNGSHTPYCYEQYWLKVFNQTFPYIVKGFKICIDGQEVGVFLYTIMKSPLWGNRIISLPFADEGGVMFHKPQAVVDGLSAQLVCALSRELDKEAQSHKVSFIEIRGDGTIPLWYEADKIFIKRKAYVKFLLDLKMPYKDIRKKFHSNIITNLRKADRSVDVRDCRAPEEIDEIYRIYLLEMRRLGGVPLPDSYFHALSQQKTTKILVALVNERIVGFIMLLTSRSRVMADINASLASVRKLFPKIRLYDAAIRWSCENGFESFDFMRTRPNTGLYSHKKKWGGVEVPVYYYTRFYNKRSNDTLDADQKRFYFPRLCVRVMPLMVLRKLGVHVRTGLGK